MTETPKPTLMDRLHAQQREENPSLQPLAPEIETALDEEAPVIPFPIHLPEYLHAELRRAAFDRNATMKFLILEALKQAGYTINAADLVTDKRKRKR